MIRHEQKSAGALVTIDSSFVRLPWHIASVLLWIVCLLCQYHCIRLHKKRKAFVVQAKSKKTPKNVISSKEQLEPQEIGHLDFEYRKLPTFSLN